MLRMVPRDHNIGTECTMDAFEDDDLECNVEKWLVLSDDEAQDPIDAMETDALLKNEDSESNFEWKEHDSSSNGDESWKNDTEFHSL